MAFMKRDFKLIYRILCHVERHTNGPIQVPDVDGYEPEVVHYHVGLCEEANYLVVAGKPSLYDGKRMFSGIERLTWDGHEALDQLRRDNGGTA